MTERAISSLNHSKRRLQKNLIALSVLTEPNVSSSLTGIESAFQSGLARFRWRIPFQLYPLHRQCWIRHPASHMRPRLGFTFIFLRFFDLFFFLEPISSEACPTVIPAASFSSCYRATLARNSARSFTSWYPLHPVRRRCTRRHSSPSSSSSCC